MQIYPLRNNSVNNLSKCVFKGNEDNKNFIGKGEVEYSHDVFKKTEREAQKLAFLDYLAYSEGDINAIAETGAQKQKMQAKKLLQI